MNNYLLEQLAPPSSNGETDTSTQPLRKRDKIPKALGFKSVKKVKNKVSQQTGITSPESSPLLISVQKNPDIEDNLLVMMSQRLQEPQLQVYIPLMAKANLRVSDKEVFSLKGKVEEFLTSDRQVMLLLGDSGAGKSTFNKHLELGLLRTYKRGGPIPLFISLPTLERPVKDLIAEQLKIYNFSDIQIQELKKHRQFIAICDGYDESQLTVNLHTSNNFNRPGQWKAKLVISCRTQYLSPDYRDCFMPQGVNHYERPGFDLFQEAVIAPFSVEQIQDYVEKYVPLEPRNWSTEDYMEKLTEIPNLMDLVKNPVLLSLALEALPDVAEGKLDISAIKITRARLYDSFVARWLDVNKRRLTKRNSLPKDDRIALDELLEAGFVTMGIDYSTKLAMAMYEKQNGNPVVQYVHLSDKKTWKAAFFSSDPEVRLIRDSSPLIRTGSQYRFLHRSILEYFYSRAIAGPSNPEPDGESAPQPTSKSSDAQLLNPECPLFTCNILAEPSVVQFLTERVQENLKFKDQLLQVVESSTINASFATAAANAITILVRAGVTFHQHDFRGIRIPGADLSGGQFDSAQFQGANLTGVNLGMSWLSQADFRNARMESVRFGELPYLEETVGVWTCLYSPQEKMLAVGLEAGGLALYDTSTWKKIRSLFGHSGTLRCLGFSLDGQRLVSGSVDKTVRVWDCSTGDLLATMIGHEKYVETVAFSPCGKYVASGSEDTVVRLWDLVSGEALFVLEMHTHIVSSIKFTPDGRLLAVCGIGGTIRFWDVVTGALRDVWELCHRTVSCMEFSPNGHQLISGHLDGNLRLWNTASRSPSPVLRGNTGLVLRCLFSADGQRIASASFDSTISLWDASERTLISTYSTSTPVFSMSFSSNGLTLAQADGFKKICIWDVSSNGSGVSQAGHTSFVTSVSYLPTGVSIISGGMDNTMRQWNALTGDLESTHVFAGLSKTPILVHELSPDFQKTAYCFMEDGTILLHDFRTRDVELVLRGHTKEILALTYSPCGRWIASAGLDKDVLLWDLHSGRQGHVRSKAGAESDAASDTEFDAVNSAQPDATLEDDESDAESEDDESDAEFEEDKPSPMALTFTSTTLLLAVGFDDGTVNIYDTQSEDLLMTATIVDQGVSALAYSPNVLELAIGCTRGVVAFWDLELEEPGHTLNFGAAATLCTTYSPWEDWFALGAQYDRVHLCRRGQSQSESSDMEASWRVVYIVEGFLTGSWTLPGTQLFGTSLSLVARIGLFVFGESWRVTMVVMVQSPLSWSGALTLVCSVWRV